MVSVNSASSPLVTSTGSENVVVIGNSQSDVMDTVTGRLLRPAMIAAAMLAPSLLSAWTEPPVAAASASSSPPAPGAFKPTTATSAAFKAAMAPAWSVWCVPSGVWNAASVATTSTRATLGSRSGSLKPHGGSSPNVDAPMAPMMASYCASGRSAPPPAVRAFTPFSQSVKLGLIVLSDRYTQSPPLPYGLTG